MENSFDHPWKASAEDIALVQQHVGLSIETDAPAVDPSMLSGEAVTEYVVDALNPQLGIVILTYRSKHYSQMHGLTQSIRSFCAALRSGAMRVVIRDVAISGK